MEHRECLFWFVSFRQIILLFQFGQDTISSLQVRRMLVIIVVEHVFLMSGNYGSDSLLIFPGFRPTYLFTIKMKTIDVI